MKRKVIKGFINKIPFINNNSDHNTEKDKNEQHKPLTLEEKERYAEKTKKNTVYHYYCISIIDCYILTLYVHL